jgi:hypothetical protein
MYTPTMQYRVENYVVKVFHHQTDEEQNLSGNSHAPQLRYSSHSLVESCING